MRRMRRPRGTPPSATAESTFRYGCNSVVAALPPLPPPSVAAVDESAPFAEPSTACDLERGTAEAGAPPVAPGLPTGLLAPAAGVAEVRGRADASPWAVGLASVRWNRVPAPCSRATAWS